MAVKGSELVSIVWIVFYVVFIAAAYFFADNKRNKALIERVGAFIFSMIALATLAGAMAPEFFSAVLGIWWYSESTINITVSVASIILTWALAMRAWEWLAALAGVSLILGSISWVITSFIL